MPANLSPEYRQAEEKYRQAQSTDERLAALQDMLRGIPKHKGTEKMQADIKRRLARLRQEKRQPKKTGGARQKPVYLVDHQGAGRICLIGPPNAGKSHLVHCLTNAQPEVADYPFTTSLPQPGMMIFENVQVQLLDMPPLHPDMSPPWLGEVIKSADALALVIDLASDEVLTDLEMQMEMLKAMGIRLVPGIGAGEIEGLIIPGEFEVESPEEEPGDLFDEEGNLRGRPQPALIVANKVDDPDAGIRLDMMLEMYQGLPVIPVSASDGQGISGLRELLWNLLGMIRVFTRAPGKDVDLGAPFTLERGSTVLDAAAAVHKDFADRFRYARAWGKGTFEGQRVSGSHVLHDGDIIEIHISS